MTVSERECQRSGRLGIVDLMLFFGIWLLTSQRAPVSTHSPGFSAGASLSQADRRAGRSGVWRGNVCLGTAT